MKVKTQAFQCFVGNHCKLIMVHAHELTAVIENGEKGKLWKSFRQSDPRYFESPFLSDEEVKDVRNSCWELGNWLLPISPMNLSHPNYTSFLTRHIPECAQGWRTLGLLTEQVLEVIHVRINSIEDVYCKIRDKPQ